LLNNQNFERTFIRMVEVINKHLPKRSKTLSEMLNEEFPTIICRDGNEYLIEKNEIEFISENVDSNLWSSFRIPIIFEMCKVGSETIVYVRDKLHSEFISKTFGIRRYKDDVLILYPHEVYRIRKKLRTASQVMFRIQV